MEGAKKDIEKKQDDLLNDRYDLSNKPAKDVTMSRGKPVQEGVRVKLGSGVTWDSLASMTPDEIKKKAPSPRASCRCRTRTIAEGGMLFPKFHIDEIKKQEDRDLTRFDLDFDFARSRLLPEFPPPIYLTTRPDLGDVSKGKLVTIDEFLSTCSTAS